MCSPSQLERGGQVHARGWSSAMLCVQRDGGRAPRRAARRGRGAAVESAAVSAASSARPTAWPCGTPAARRSSPVDRRAHVAQVVEPALRRRLGAQRPGQRDGLAGRRAPPQRSRTDAPPRLSLRSSASRPGHGHHGVPLTRARSPSASSRPASAAGATARHALAEQQEVGAAVGGQQRQRALGDRRDRRRSPRTHRGHDADPLERRRRAGRLAQQQPQLGAQPRRRHRRQRAVRDRRVRQRARSRPRPRTPAAPRSAPAAAAASGRRGTSARAARAARRASRSSSACGARLQRPSASAPRSR